MCLSLHSLTKSKAQNDGAIAQLVEQRTENPCVPGSNPGGTTEREVNASLFFVLMRFRLRVDPTTFVVNGSIENRLECSAIPIPE